MEFLPRRRILRLAAALIALLPAALAAGFDSVMVSLSKGLGAPVGSVLLLPRALLPEARRYRKVMGGGMRQAGVLAAAALVALLDWEETLARDHARMLLRRRRRRGPACKLNVQFQFVVQAANAHEVGPFLAYWGDLVACQGGDWHDEVLFKRLSVGGGAAGQV